MPEIKHTPGPWEVLNQTEVFTLLGADSGDGVKAMSCDGWMIADCGDSQTFSEAGFVELGLDVRKANAKLIAAAPDLLAAAIEVLNGLNDRIDSAVEDRRPTPIFEGIAALSAAIAKATQ